MNAPTQNDTIAFLEKREEELMIEYERRYAEYHKELIELVKKKNLYKAITIIEKFIQDIQCHLRYPDEREGFHSMLTHLSVKIQRHRSHIRKLLTNSDYRKAAYSYVKSETYDILDEEIARHIEGAREKIVVKLDKVICNCLGIDQSWGNDVRIKDGSVIAAHLHAKCKKLVDEAVEAVLTPEKCEELKKEIEPALLKTYKQVFLRAFETSVQELAKQYANVLAKELLDDPIKILQAPEMRTDMDLNDPKTGDKAYQIAVMKDIIQELENEQ